MSLVELEKEILADAQTQAKAIVKEAQNQVKTQHAAALEEYDDKLAEELEAFKVELTLLERREIAAASLEAKKKVFSAKKELLDKVFEEVEKKLQTLPAKERKQIITALERKAAKQLKVAKIYCNKKDQQYINAPTQTKQLLGGLIAENKQGTINVDFSFEALLTQTKEKSMQEVTKVLFE